MTIDINKLRRLAQAAMTGPDGVSLNWIKLLQDFQQAASPTAVLELLDRLEAAEKELAELRSSMKFRTSLIGRTEAERDKLRAELDALKAALNKIADGYYKSFEQHEVSLRMQEIARKALTAAPKPEESK